MASTPPPPDEVLTRYLLGELSTADADHLDASSVSDEEFFERLDALENDLIDSYVSGGMPAPMQERFRRGYLTSAARAEKVRFAEALARRGKRPASVVPMKPRASRVVPWMLPMAAGIVIVGLGLVFLPDNQDAGPTTSTPTPVAQAPGERPGTVQPVPAPNVPPLTAVEGIYAFTLAAPRRSVEAPSSITIPAVANNVTLRMEVELDDYPRYRAVLKQAGDDRVLWRSGVLTSEAQGAGRVVPAVIPARHFDEGRYLLELTGVTAGGAAEPVAAYAFNVGR